MNMSKLGTPTAPRCHSCGRKITLGKENRVMGKLYGSECVQKALDKLNSRGVSG